MLEIFVINFEVLLLQVGVGISFEKRIFCKLLTQPFISYMHIACSESLGLENLPGEISKSRILSDEIMNLPLVIDPKNWHVNGKIRTSIYNQKYT